MEEKRMILKAKLVEQRRKEDCKQMQQMMLTCLQTLYTYSQRPNYMPTQPTHHFTPVSPSPLPSATPPTLEHLNTFSPTLHLPQYSEAIPRKPPTIQFPHFYTYLHNSSN